MSPQASDGERAARLMELLGLSEDELCRTLDVDPLTLLSGQLDQSAELPILLALLDEAAEQAGPKALRALGAVGRASRPPDRRTDAPRLRRLRGRRHRPSGARLRAARRRRVTLDPYRYGIRVRYAECDPQGVVFNSHYLAYFDIAMTELWRAAFGGYGVMMDRGIDLVVAEAQLRFRASARFDDELTLEVSVTNMGTTAISTEHRIRRDDELLVEGTLRHVVVSLETMAKTPIPDWIRDGLAPWAVAERLGRSRASPAARATRRTGS